MNCAWQEYLNILPVWLRQAVQTQEKTLLETRLRLGRETELITANGTVWLDRAATLSDLKFCINTATKYSPWNARTSANGYVTASGGHRIGICGDAVVREGKCDGIREPTSLCIRVARDFPGIAKEISKLSDSFLIAGAPGSGKTTLLRDVIRSKSEEQEGSICVVDERCEIFPTSNGEFCFPAGNRTDIMSGADKCSGIDMVLRSMTPKWIAVDEITAQEDCDAMIRAGNCGVKLIATLHAGSREDLYRRTVYQPLIQSGFYHYLVLLQPDKTWSMERI